MAPSNAKNLDYLIPLVQREHIIAGLLLPPNAQYPDGSAIGQPFPRIPVPKGLRMGTGWRIRTEGASIPNGLKYEHPFDSAQTIHRHLTNYEKITIPLTRYACMDGRDKDHVMGTSAPDDFDAEIGFGMREVLYASVEQAIADDIMAVANYTGNATAGPGFCVDCTGAEWSGALINPFTDATSGLVTALTAMFLAGKYPSGILMDVGSWGALISNPLAQVYIRQNVLLTLPQLGQGTTIPLSAVQYALKIDPFPAVNVYVGLSTYMGTIAPDGLYDANDVTNIWPAGEVLIYCQGGVRASRLQGQAFCVVNDGGDEFEMSTESGFSTNTIDYRYNLYAGHNVIDWTNATLLYNVI